MPGRRAGLLLAAAATGCGAGAVLVDGRFWYRWVTMPGDAGEWPASFYQPTTTIPGDPGGFFPVATQEARSIAPEALAAAADWAGAHNSVALLVLHRGTLQLERYWQGMSADSLFTGRAMTRSLIPPLIAIAMAEGAIASVDDRVERYLAEWRGSPQGQISLRNLLQNVSGLENPGMTGDPSPFGKNNRLALGSDLRAAALRFELADPPGELFMLANANAQLLAAVLESATGEAFENYLDSRLWAPLGAGPAELYMDRPGGMPAAFCCFRATPRDWLRYGEALRRDGLVGERRLWPSGWIDEMVTPSIANPNYGYQIWVGNPEGELRAYAQDGQYGVAHGPAIAAEDVYFLEGGGHRTLYVLPAEELVILRLGYSAPGWQTSTLPNLVLAGIASAE